MGYEDEQINYRLWDQKKKKIITHRDVIFYEDRASVDIEKAEKLR